MGQELDIFFYLNYFLIKYLYQFLLLEDSKIIGKSIKSIDVEFLVTVST